MSYIVVRYLLYFNSSKRLSDEDKQEVHYSSYLQVFSHMYYTLCTLRSLRVQLDKILNSQLLLSEKHLGKKVHDEHLFIVIHQGLLHQCIVLVCVEPLFV